MLSCARLFVVCCGGRDISTDMEQQQREGCNSQGVKHGTVCTADSSVSALTEPAQTGQGIENEGPAQSLQERCFPGLDPHFGY